MINKYDFLQGRSWCHRVTDLGAFGCLAHTSGSKDTLEMPAKYADMSIYVLHRNNEHLVWSWRPAYGDGAIVTDVISGCQDNQQIMRLNPDVIIIDASAFGDERLDSLVWYGSMSGFSFVLAGTDEELSQRSALRLIGIIATVGSDVWPGDEYGSKIDKRTADAFARAEMAEPR